MSIQIPAGQWPEPPTRNTATSVASQLLDEWEREFAKFKESVSRPPVLKDCIAANELLERYSGPRSQLHDICASAGSCALGATLLGRVMSDLNPWMVKTCITYLRALCDLARYCTYSGHMKRGAATIRHALALQRKMKLVDAEGQEATTMRVAAMIAESLIARGAAELHLHLRQHDKAMVALKRACDIYSALLDDPNQPLGEHSRDYQMELARTLVTFAGAVMHLVQESAALGSPQPRKFMDDAYRIVASQKPYLESSGAYLVTLAKLHIARGHPDEALGVLDQAEILEGDAAKWTADAAILLLQTRGWALSALGRDSESILHFERVVEIITARAAGSDSGASFADIDALDSLSILYRRVGRGSDARMVQAKAATLKKHLRRYLIAFGDEEVRLRYLVSINEFSLLFDMADDVSVAETIINAKNAVLGALCGEVVSQRDLSIDEVQSRLSPETTYVDFMEYEDWKHKVPMLAVLTIRSNAWGLERMPLTGADSENLRLLMSATFSESRIDVDDTALMAALASVFNLLLRPRLDFARPFGPTKLLLISPSGNLHDVPWWALTENGREPVVTAMDLCLLSSARSILRPTPSPGHVQRVNVVADPEDEGSSARREAEAVRDLWRSKGASVEVWLSEDATRDKLLRATDVLHVACHAARKESPGHPYDQVVLRLAGPDGVDEVSARGIGQQKLERQLVVLAACHTGQGGESAGEGRLVFEGRFGLARAFIISGADTVVTSLWRLRDPTSPEFFEAFYGGTGGWVQAFNEALRRSWKMMPSAMAGFALEFGGLAVQR